VFGSQFTNSGFNLRVPSMVPGGYLFVAHAHNAALNAFAAPVTVRAQIVSSTLTTIDVPAVGQTTRPGASVSGWALNRDATSGTGIDAVHVWAYPNPGSGQAPAYIGVASYGVFRPDVGAAFGSSFNNAGFTITIPSLTPGEYLFVAFPHNVASNAFDPPATRRVTVTP
jgi:hypothetical protein